jgi:putative transposase
MNAPLLPGKYYHIYNHANGSENLFYSHDNYLFFLKKYVEHILPIVDTFAYCLMPNHFHLAVRIKMATDLKNLEGLQDLQSLERFISQQFSNFFNAYSKAFNKQHNRRGNLFVHTFKRKQIDSDDYFKRLIHYIHFNPVHHNFVEDLRDWKYSSYESFFSEQASKINREEVIDWFGNQQAFFDFHQKEIDEKMVLELEVIR